MFKENRIRSLEEKNKTLKNENEDLKKQLSKEFACPICTRSYNKSNDLYNHLQKGDEEHRRLAQKRYENTKCETCGKECARWRNLTKHMAVHEQKVVRFMVELNVKPDASKFLIATSALSNRVNANVHIYSCVTFAESLCRCFYSSRDYAHRNTLVSTLTSLRLHWWRLTLLGLWMNTSHWKGHGPLIYLHLLTQKISFSLRFSLRFSH